MIGVYISLALLIIVSGIHIFSLVKRDYKLKSITKVFILPLIISFYLCATKEINWLVFSALVCGWVGDIILIPKKKTAVAIGGWVFLTGQILMTVAIILKINMANVSLALLIVLPIIFFIYALLFNLIEMTKYVSIVLLIFGTGYLAVNGLTCSMSLCYLISNPCWQTGLIFVGAFLFLLSDTVLIYVRMSKNPKIDERHIFIMCSYIVAQFLEMFGFIV